MSFNISLVNEAIKENYPFDMDETENLASSTISVDCSEQMHFAEIAVAGWEKAKLESIRMKDQLNDLTQLKEFSDRRVIRLELSLKESVMELRKVREMLAGFMRLNFEMQFNNKQLSNEVERLKETLNMKEGGDIAPILTSIIVGENNAQQEMCFTCKTQEEQLNQLEQEITGLIANSEKDQEVIKFLSAEVQENSAKALIVERDSMIVQKDASVVNYSLNNTKLQVEGLIEQIKLTRDQQRQEMVENSNLIQETLVEENNSLQDKNKELMLKIKAMEEEKNLEELSANVKLFEDLQQSKEQVKTLTEELAMSRQENEYLDTELSNLEEMIAKLSAGLEEKDKMSEEISESKKRVSELEKKAIFWEDKASKMEADLAAAVEKADMKLKEGETNKILAEELAKAKGQVNELSEELMEWRDETKALQSDLDWATSRIQQLTAVEAENKELKQKFDTYVVAAKEKVKVLLEEKDRLTEELDASMSSFDEISEMYTQEAGLVDTCLLELRALKSGEKHKAKDLEQKRLKATSLRSERQKEGETVHELAKNARRDRELIIQELENLRGRCENLTLELEASRNWTDDLNFHIEAQNELKFRLENEIAVISNEKARLQEDLSAAEKKISSLQNELQKLQSRQRMNPESNEVLANQKWETESEIEERTDPGKGAPQVLHQNFKFGSSGAKGIGSPGSSGSSLAFVKPNRTKSTSFAFEKHLYLDLKAEDSSDPESSTEWRLTRKQSFGTLGDFSTERDFPKRKGPSRRRPSPRRRGSSLSREVGHMKSSPSHDSIVAERTSCTSSPESKINLKANSPEENSVKEILPSQVFASQWPASVGEAEKLKPINTAQFSTSSFSSASPVTTPVSVLPEIQGCDSSGLIPKSPRKFLNLFPPKSPRGSEKSWGITGSDEKKSSFGNFFGKSKRVRA